MKKHKSLSRSAIPRVQQGGKFVALDAETEGCRSVSRKKQAEKILATAVMGMNLVNTVAPLAALVGAEQKLSAVSQPVRSEAEPLDYAVLPQLADAVDNLVFARAYARMYDGTANVPVMYEGDEQHNYPGQNAIVSTMSGGYQEIGGTGTVSTMSGGSQSVHDGGTGTVSAMISGRQDVEGSSAIGTVITMSDDGQQVINFSGTGKVSTMNGGVQVIDRVGIGIVDVMNSGIQGIDKGTGTVSTMNNGSQIVRAGGSGTIDVMISGEQNITSGAAGTVNTMSGGNQNVNGGTGTVSTMSGGSQRIYSGAGTVSTMINGSQRVDGGTGTIISMNSGYQAISGGSGTIDSMNDGRQWIVGSGTGTINVMQGGGQLVGNGTGTISTMSGGSQTINVGTGTVSTMINGSQNVNRNTTGTIDIMSGGMQSVVQNANGIINTMSNGNQKIIAGTGTVSTMISGEQNIIGGGTGTISAMSGGTQKISNGGSGTVSTMFGGSQTIESGGSGTVSTMSYGYQNIYSGGTGTINMMQGGTQTVDSGGTALDTVIAGGTQQVKWGAVVSGATLSAGIQEVYDGTNLNNITFAGGTQAVMSGAAVSGMQVAAGQQRVENGGTAINTEIGADGSVQLSSGGIISSLTLTSGSLELENIDGGSFTVSGTLTVNNATVDMTDSSIKRGVPSVAYETLTIDKLSGSGTTFIMDTDLAGETNSDKITITDADAGTHYVQIKDLSQLNDIEVTGAHQQILITDNSGKLNFEGKEFNAGGLWDVDPTLAKQGNDWYLTKIAKTANNDTRVLLDAADNSYALWRNTNDSLRSRLGALASGSEQSDGIWARTQAGRFSGDNYEGRYNLYQLGFDQAADAKSVYGAAVDYGDGTGSYDNGSGKDKLKSFSLYGVWTGDNGAYTNVTARYGMVSTDLESYGDYPDKAEYKQHAYSVSVEYGKRITLDKNWFIEPQAQFTLGRLGSIDYTTDRGANGYIEGMNSAIGRIGFVMGQKIKNDSDIYLKADLLHEFAGERDLQLTSDAGGTNDSLRKHNDYGDTWFELGLGANIKVSKTASLYGEIERGFGGDINKKWSVNGGVRFTF